MMEATRLAGEAGDDFGEGDLEAEEAAAAAAAEKAARKRERAQAAAAPPAAPSPPVEVLPPLDAGPSIEEEAQGAAWAAAVGEEEGGDGDWEVGSGSDDDSDEDEDGDGIGEDDEWEAAVDAAAAALASRAFSKAGGGPAEDSSDEDEEEEDVGYLPPPDAWDEAADAGRPRGGGGRGRSVIMALSVAAAAAGSVGDPPQLDLLDLITGETLAQDVAGEGDRAVEAGAVANQAGGAGTLADALNAVVNVASLVAAARALQGRLGGAVHAELDEALSSQARLYDKKSIPALREAGAILTGLAAVRDDGGAPARRGMANLKLTIHPGALGAAGLVEEEAEAAAGQDGTAALPMPQHGFSVRDPVALAPTSDLGGARPAPGRPAPIEGTVVQVRRSSISVSIPAGRADDALLASAGQAWRLDKTVPDVTAMRQLAALAALDRPWAEVAGRKGSGMGGGGAFDEGVARSLRTLRDRQGPPTAHSGAWTVAELRVRSVLLGAPGAKEKAETPPPWAEGGTGGGGERAAASAAAWSALAGRLLSEETGLNQSQRAAIAAVLSSSVTLWQGPPGTGKTRTLTALLTVLAKASRGDASGRPLTTAGADAVQAARAAVPVLACGDTNAAADGLALGLDASGVRVVRLGSAPGPAVRKLTLAAVAAITPAGKAASNARSLATAALFRSRALQRAGDEPGCWAAKDEAATWKREAQELEEQAAEAAMASVEVVCTTTAGAGDARRMGGLRFRAVVLDEATQATEPSLLVPLVRGAECVVLAGDPRQLPPTVTTPAAKAAGLDQTLFERLQRAGLVTHLLDTQYRMHPTLAAFPSDRFYGGALKSWVTPEDAAPPPAGFPWPAPSIPLALVETDPFHHPESWGRSDSGPSQGGAGSVANPGEAVLAVRAAAALLASGGVKSVAILTPYTGQVRALRQLLGECGADAVTRAAITVSTVDGFQGREADAVVFSAVRCNETGALGFVADPRRMNVALTRARLGCVVIGHAPTLGAAPDWAAWLTWVTDAGALLPAGALPAAEWEARAGNMWERFRRGVAPSRAGGQGLRRRASPQASADRDFSTSWTAGEEQAALPVQPLVGDGPLEWGADPVGWGEDWGGGGGGSGGGGANPAADAAGAASPDAPW